MTTIESKMLEVLTRTLKTQQTLQQNGSSALASKTFEDFLAQVKLVEDVTGRRIEIAGEPGKFKVEFREA